MSSYFIYTTAAKDSIIGREIFLGVISGFGRMKLDLKCQFYALLAWNWTIKKNIYLFFVKQIFK